MKQYTDHQLKKALVRALPDHLSLHPGSDWPYCWKETKTEAMRPVTQYEWLEIARMAAMKWLTDTGREGFYICALADWRTIAIHLASIRVITIKTKQPKA